MSIYVDGNAARQIEEPPKKQRTDEEARKRRAEKARADARREQSLRRQQGLIRATVIMAVTAAVLILAVTLLNGTVRSNSLTTEIRDLESRYNTIVSQNDSKEYDIDRAVDLNTIIKTATEEYGMVRGSVDQIITYRTDDSEYIQQLAELPQN